MIGGLPLLDYDDLANRLIVLSPGRLAASFAVRHLGTQLMYLDLAVDDYDAASAELLKALHWHREFIVSYENVEDAVDALTRSGDIGRLEAVGVRFHYRLDSAYGTARRVLDRVVVVAHESLPRTRTDLGKSHNGFGPRLVMRCNEVGVEVPEGLLQQIDDLDARIKAVRDQIEHVKDPLSYRWLDAGDELIVGSQKVSRSDDDAAERPKVPFEPPAVVREAIHDYVGAMVDLLEAAPRS